MRQRIGGGQRRGGARWAALGLLLVFLGGLSLTTLTHDWIGQLPYHDHLLVGARSLGLHHHAHRGDPLDQALTALGPAAATLTHEEAFALAQGATPPDQPYVVVSLRSSDGVQPELNTYTALGLLAIVAVMRLAVRRGPLVRAALPARAGCAHAPPLPPPRAA